MSVFSGLVRDVRQIKNDLTEILKLQQQATEGLTAMATKAEELKSAITGISEDITEIDGDITEILDKLNGMQDGATADQVAELLTLANDIKTRTRSAADKVPESTTPPPTA